MTDAYRDRLDLLHARLDYERLGMPARADLNLGRMRRLIRRLGDPQDVAPIVHVAGTKGKGSTAAMVAASLTAAGIRTGLFTSPHLHRLEERYAIDGELATPEEIVELVDLVLPAVAELDAIGPGAGGRALTFFEITTAMGLLHFARRGCRAVVLEVGMGGRLDSTNVVRPAVSVITTISLDHTRQLGSTLGAIATEKAGILKRGRPAVVGVRGDEARAAIRRVAAPRRAPLLEIDRDYRYDYRPPAPPVLRPSTGTVSLTTWRRRWPDLAAPLPGEHQAQNLATAVATLDRLGEAVPDLDVDHEAVVRGLAGLRWPARMEVVGESPWTVIDGAHNVASAEALAEALRTCFPAVPRVLVFGASREKDHPGQLRALLPHFDRVVATRYLENPRAEPSASVAAAVETLGGSVTVADDPAEALAVARRLAGPGGLVCVTGSLFLAAEARAVVLGLSGETAAPRVPV